MGRVQELMAGGFEIFRLYTTMHPRHFESVKQFEVSEVAISPELSSRSSLHQTSAKVIQWLFESRFSRYLTNFLFFWKSPSRWLKAYSPRTYIIPKNHLVATGIQAVLAAHSKTV